MIWSGMEQVGVKLGVGVGNLGVRWVSVQDARKPELIVKSPSPLPQHLPHHHLEVPWKALVTLQGVRPYFALHNSFASHAY